MPWYAVTLPRPVSREVTEETVGREVPLAVSFVLGAQSSDAVKNCAKDIARELVYEYKDHGFVIDADEARAHLGEEWILLDSPEARFAEKLYRLYEEVDVGLRLLKNSRLLLVGEATYDFMILKATT